MKATVRVLAVLFALVAVLAMVGCQNLAEQAAKKAVESATGAKVEDDKVTITGDDGQSLTISAEGEMPEDFPDDVPVYEPGTVKSTLSTDVDGGKSHVVGIESPDAPGDVFSWYESELKDGGWNVASTVKTDSGGIINAEKDDLALTVLIGEGDGAATMLTLTVGPKES